MLHPKFQQTAIITILVAIASPAGALAQNDNDTVREAVAVLGQLTDQLSGEPVSTARVEFHPIEGQDAPVWEGVSDQAGMFVATGLVTGEYEFRAEVIGYAPIVSTVDFSQGGDVDLRVEMVPEAVALEPVLVAVRRATRLETRGFYERQAAGIGHFLTRADIEMRGPWRVADLFYGVPGARVIPGRPGQPVPTVLLRNNCNPLIVLDGSPISNRIRLDEILNPGDLEAIEVYHGASAPIQYTQFTTCGTIMVWTRETRLQEGQPFSWWRMLGAGVVVGVLYLISQ
jgi:hypothetical protein